MEDRELLEGLRRGDQRSFDAIFRAHYPHLVAFVERMLRQRAVAEDIAQDVLLELWRRRESLVVQDSLRAYLFQAARNRAYNHTRHLRIEERSEPELVGEGSIGHRGDAYLAEEEIETALRSAVAELPPRCREVFELSRVHGMRYAEIATALGIPVKTVESQMGKALGLLRVRLAAWLPATEQS